MRAMILAAGLGTRLRPLTNDRPKALVEVGGRTLLEITLRRLASFGIREVIVNVHHFADMVVEYLSKNRNFGMRVEISREQVLLDTGGGLKKAAWFFLQATAAGQAGPKCDSFILHNVDVISSIDLAKMLQFHEETKALATLAVHKRETSRYLLFDDRGRLCGRRKGSESPEMVSGLTPSHPLAFSGVHAISTRLLPMITEDGVFSLISTYLRLARQGENLLAFRADDYYWRDLGKPESVKQATADIERLGLQI
jgi:NDP-sugar pyrophosphorylase family protein